MESYQKSLLAALSEAVVVVAAVAARKKMKIECPVETSVSHEKKADHC